MTMMQRGVEFESASRGWYGSTSRTRSHPFPDYPFSCFQ